MSKNQFLSNDMRKHMLNRKSLFKGTFAILVIAASLSLIIVVNDRKHVSRQISVEPGPAISIKREPAIQRLREAIGMETVSVTSPARTNDEPFVQFAAFLENAFPTVHTEPITRKTGNDFGDSRNHTLLYRWPGSDPALQPILLMAHYDVVPVEPEKIAQWTHAPFSSEFDDSFIWGRGTLDAKNSAIAMMEAISILIGDGFTPRRTFYLSLGHDEEVGGTHGNRRVAQWMKSEGIRLQTVLDEGGCIFRDFPGLQKSVALIGIAEKGFANVRLTATLDDGGHASMPPKQTAIEVLAAAIDRLNQTPLPRRIGKASESMLDYLGPEMAWPNRLAIANRWLFGPLITQKLGVTESGNAMLRTTMAPTMIRGGVRENVLPSHANAVINVRLMPGDRLSDVIEHIKRTIADDRIAIEVDATAREASRLSSIDSAEFGLLHRSIKEVYPDVVVAPFVLVGGTDSYHFQDIAKNIYRFIPSRLNAADLKRIHGVDERIAKDDYIDLIRFYVQFIKNSASGDPKNR